MSQEKLEEFAHRVVDDAAFAEEFRANPVGTATKFGLLLTKSAIAAMGSVDWKSMSGDEISQIMHHERFIGWHS